MYTFKQKVLCEHNIIIVKHGQIMMQGLLHICFFFFNLEVGDVLEDKRV